MFNRSFKISTLLVLALVFVMTSCQKESLSDLTTENFTEQTENGERGPMMGKGKKGKKGGQCFKPVFPITLNFSDGTSAEELADKDAVKAAVEAWKEANPDATERPTIAFPHDVELADGTIVTVESEEDVAALREACGGDRGGKGGKGKGGKCFKPVFPITLNFSDGSSAEDLADKDAVKAAVEAWKEANPDATERPTIAFPYDVMLRDSSILTITSEEDLAALKETCGDNRGGRGERCFKPVFPITINFSDGTSAEDLADKDAVKAAVEAWKEANPDATERPTIAFPHDVELADGTIVTVESEEDVAALREACGGERGERGNGPRPGGN